MVKIFIDGSAGTTGLRIADRLAGRDDLHVTVLPEEKRKDAAARAAALNAADIAILCLPDAAAREAAEWIDDPDTVVLDTSTVHRTAPGWAYGFPELSAAHAQAVRTAKRIAVPGCNASRFIALTAPLAASGIIPAGTQLSCFSLTGYSGGGKSMIGRYTTQPRPEGLHAPRQYALGQTHKHLPEMAAQSGLPAPLLCPVVGDYLQRDAGDGAAIRRAVRVRHHTGDDRRGLPRGVSRPGGHLCRYADEGWLSVRRRAGGEGHHADRRDRERGADAAAGGV